MNAKLGQPLLSFLSWKSKPVPRDKLDTLILVIACFIAITNHFSAAPIWVSLSSSAVMLWRAYLTFSGRSLPSKYILIPIACGLMGGIFFNFRSFFGREAGVSMLILLLACKMLEMHAKRDLFVVVFLGFFLILTSFFESQSLVSALQVSASALALLLAQISYQFQTKTIPVLHRLKIIFKLVGLAIPLTVVCFFLFPRLQGPLWGLPSDANIARSGLSDSMSPGNISKLAMSEELVFRVKFIDPVPNKSRLYWRAIILDEFDGRTWTAINKLSIPRAIDPKNVTISGNGIRHEITIEPSSSQNLFGLDLSPQAPQLIGGVAYVTRNAEIVSPFPLQNRTRYQIQSYPEYQLDLNIDPNVLRQTLNLPRRFNPKTAEFAEQIRSQYRTPKEQIAAILKYFRNEAFFYTLEPPPLGRNTIDDFLFQTRAGFCEHYASSFSVLMRYLQIPSRVVTGYQGGSVNSQDGYLEVRQSDAHAWAEVWIENEGWVRVDPTAAVAPDRILKNLNATQKTTGLSGLVSNMMSQNGFMNEIRMRWSALNNTWNQWVLNYNETKQNDLLRSLGLKDVDWQNALVSLFLIGLLVLGFLSLPLLRPRTQLAPLDKLYFTLCVTLKKRGLGKSEFEGPRDFLKRLEPHLNETDFLVVQQIINHYIDQKYGRQTSALTTQELKRRIKKLK
ncbi:DUF3488 domain-containing transglutaminase family protein [Undibacterium sp. LX40W]|uniref:DUF3488 domain-containing transglutaminase family protein n=1 Tax=Undibacterium nitidum TaxID=2762298 RepID=A0A923HPD2_9BURK|nr:MULTISPECIES: DUF3488 and transglutaminase-like domain-containing protein [Undibacterium]MBC3882103.1 DUF3488 domain-containing transglutaminase family protein [Undibacterium nitidum]MBC3892384.1 DUF3488 domain-containing transglutaminase family protein [Undibacterium sp. LX40W]